MRRYARSVGLVVALLIMLLVYILVTFHKGPEEGDNDPNYYKGKEFHRPGSGPASGHTGSQAQHDPKEISKNSGG